MKIALWLALMAGFSILSGCILPGSEAQAPGTGLDGISNRSSAPILANYTNDSTHILLNSSFFRDFDADGYDDRSIFFDEKTILKDSDQYKIISALRMLGYIFEVPKDSPELPHVNALRRFKSNNGMPLTGDGMSEQVTEEVIIRLDEGLAASDAENARLASRFPFYNETVSDHPNGLSREFIASTMMRAFYALPGDLVNLSRMNMLDCFIYQCYNPAFHSSDDFRFIYNATSGDPVFQIPESDPAGGFIFYDWVLVGPNTSSQETGFSYRSGGSAIVMTIHEYAHFLDSAVYVKKKGTTRGLINATGFASISWMNKSGAGALFERQNGSEDADFITMYATKNSWEDFAESFAAYVAYGQDFRAEAAKNAVLKRKYGWLKENVFHGVEYDTDIPYIRQDYGYVFDGNLDRLE
jgi:hypothetical protein